MELTGEQHVPSKPEVVWEALNDPEVLKACIPGCEHIEKVSDNEYHAQVTQKIGPVKASFSGSVTLSDLEPPERYTITFGGKSRAGSVDGRARINLQPAENGTLISYTANAKVAGKLAQVGSRMIDASARKVSSAFFDNLVERLGAAPERAPEAPTPEPGVSPSLVWIGGGAVAVAVLITLVLAFG